MKSAECHSGFFAQWKCALKRRVLHSRYEHALLPDLHWCRFHPSHRGSALLKLQWQRTRLFSVQWPRYAASRDPPGMRAVQRQRPAHR